MIHETTILHLQLIATILMGIDYFVSEKLKEKIDLYVKQKIERWQKNTDKRIIELSLLLKTSGFRKLKKSIIFLILWLTIAITTSIIVGRFFLSEYATLVYIIGMFITAILSFIFAKNLIDFIGENILTFILPLISRLITTFILFIKKGVVAGLGILILLISFGCRYYNSYYAGMQ